MNVEEAISIIESTGMYFNNFPMWRLPRSLRSFYDASPEVQRAAKTLMLSYGISWEEGPGIFDEKVRKMK